MAELITTDTLARWTQNDPAEVAADPFALDLIDKLSQLVCYVGGHDGTKLDYAGVVIPEWTLTPGPDQAPIDVQMVVLQVAKRSYENPGQVIQEGSVGPLGGDRVSDIQALFMDLTEAERAVVSKYNVDGDPTAQPGSGTIYTIPTTRGDETTLPATYLYATDDQQIALDLSPDPRPWMIPLFNPGDPGDPANYDGTA